MRTLLYTFALIGILSIGFVGYFATNTAVAASSTTVTATSSVSHTVPQTVAQAAVFPKAPSVEEPVITTPVQLSIPSIKLTAPIIKVGLTAKGEMDVPSGSTNNVGWYKDGTLPGTDGSAVLDAHVFAALKNLRYAKVGDSVYVKTENGQTLHFVIHSSMLYALADVPRELLFNRTGGDYLNLITCAGTFDSKLGTYDHRLIVYAELANS